MNANIMSKILAESRFITDKVRILFILFLVAFIFNMSFPQAVQAQAFFGVGNQGRELILVSAARTDLITQKFYEYEYQVEKLKAKKPIRVATVVATAYSSDVAQTDSTPCITADGYNVCEHGEEDVIAANFLPFGAKVRIPEIYGDKIFTVHDRMNQRYTYRIDLWKISRNDAITFGKRLVKLEIVEY